MHLTDNKQPETGLLDLEFHAEVEVLDLSMDFDTWSADCYNALVMYRRATSVEAKKAYCVRAAQSAKEAAEIIVPTGVWLSSIADNWRDGIRGSRIAFNWMNMRWDTDVEAKYLAKALRHLSQADMACNAESRINHLAAVFCNANILWRRCGGENE